MWLYIVSVELDDGFVLDYRLTQSPLITNQFIESSHKVRSRCTPTGVSFTHQALSYINICGQRLGFCARRDSIERNSYGNVAGWLAGWVAGWLGVCHTPVLYQNG